MRVETPHFIGTLIDLQEGFSIVSLPFQVQLRPDNCPPGLEYLTQVDQIIVKQKVEIMEALFGCETKNKYKLKNSMGQEVYSAKEDTDCCTRNCCGPIRPFGMTIKDNNDQERHRTGQKCPSKREALY